MRIGRPPDKSRTVLLFRTHSIRTLTECTSLNYKKIHDQIISRAKSREIPDCYCERHHIIPKSMGGSDDADNIAVLTAREHFIIHWLLMKIHRNKQMVYAFHCMTKPVGNGRTRYTSISFKYAREAIAKWNSENMSGENHPLYGIIGKDHPHYGMKRNKKARKNMSIAAKKRYETEVHPTAREVFCIETGEKFSSIHEAEKKHTKGNINHALKTGGTAEGLHFSYVGQIPIIKENNYAKGSRVSGAVAIVDQFGNKYETYRQAGASISVTGQAVKAAVKDGRKCKGVYFYHDNS